MSDEQLTNQLGTPVQSASEAAESTDNEGPTRCCGAGRVHALDWAGQSMVPVVEQALTFERAQVQGADFRGLDVRGLNFRYADARGAQFDGANLAGADFTGALLQGARFRHADLRQVSFRQSLLLSAHLEHAQVEGATFAGANLEWAWLDGVDFQLASVACAVFLNGRGLSEATRQVIEKGGGFTGSRPMILGRELYETASDVGADVPDGPGAEQVR